ncbi:hypothetical protein [Sutcliffiella deserti]|uniref:hypothetical protein n=1 Tax=Sutcliffiella deserti TaxID=2875501 RepID=UPI001CBC0B42|nr:hypothetical protein [Sutcliffiella deserti]
MIGLILAIILFNIIAFKMEKNLNRNQMLHIWLFTIAFQQTHDIVVEFKYGAYWYLTQDVDWVGLLAHTVLIPPVNVIFLNYFPFKKGFFKQSLYIGSWTLGILLYELLALLPEPWGYFNYGWWKLQYSAIVDPILLLILVGFFKCIRKLERYNK